MATLFDDISNELNTINPDQPVFMVKSHLSDMLSDLEDQVIASVPNTDPLTEGAFWNDGGTLTVSAGA
jgi:hypothetical protein